MFYCRPEPLSDYSTALVIVPDNSITPAPGTSSRVSDMINALDKGGFNPLGRGNRSHYKEKGVVIKVKKNQAFEEMPKKDNEQSGIEEGTDKVVVAEQTKDIDMNNYDFVDESDINEIRPII